MRLFWWLQYLDKNFKKAILIQIQGSKHWPRGYATCPILCLILLFVGGTLQLSRCQHYKMVKNTQTIRRLLPMNCLSVFDHFVRLALEGIIVASVYKKEIECNGFFFQYGGTYRSSHRRCCIKKAVLKNFYIGFSF